MKRLLPYLPALCLSAVILLLSLIDPTNLPNASALRFAGQDKVIHFLMYAMLTTFLLYPMSKAQRLQLPVILRAALLASLYGLLMEVCQFLFTSSRSMEVLDAIANLAGALIVAAAFYLHAKRGDVPPGN